MPVGGAVLPSTPSSTADGNGGRQCEAEHTMALAARLCGSPDSRVGVVIATPRLLPPRQHASSRHVQRRHRDCVSLFRRHPKQRDPRVHACIAHGGTARSAATISTYCLVNRLRPHTKHNTWGLPCPAGCTRHRDACGAVIATPSRLARPPPHQGAGYGLLVLHGHAIVCISRCRTI